MISLIIVALLPFLYYGVKMFIEYKKKMYIFSHIRGEVFSAEHFKYIMKNKEHYNNLTDEGKNNYLKTFFVNETIMELYFNVSNKIFKRAIELEEDDNYDETSAIIQASNEIGKLTNAKNIEYTKDIDANVYKIIGSKHFLEYPNEKSNLPLKLPLINRIALVNSLK